MGTLHDWEQTEPTLIAILNHYKVMYGKPVVEDPSQNGQGDPGEGLAQADGAQDWVVRLSDINMNTKTQVLSETRCNYLQHTLALVLLSRR